MDDFIKNAKNNLDNEFVIITKENLEEFIKIILDEYNKKLITSMKIEINDVINKTFRKEDDCK